MLGYHTRTTPRRECGPHAVANTCCRAEPVTVGTPPPPLMVKAGRLVDARNGSEVHLHGINWFGFNVSRGACRVAALANDEPPRPT